MKTFDKKFWWIFCVFLCFIIVVLSFPFLFTQHQILKGIHFEDSGPIGDTIGGILGPFIAIGAAVLTFLAFWVQYKANEQQKIDLQIERFENRFYQLLQLHRNNINEISIRTRTKQKAFISMFNELKFVYFMVKEVYRKTYLSLGYEEISDTKLYNIAYFLFFYGCKPKAIKMINLAMNNRHSEFINIVSKKLEELSSPIEGETLTVSDEKDEPFTLRTWYNPFLGHTSRLGHYFRHVFQIVKYIDEHYPNKDDFDAKYDYVRTLRAQLSSYEQLMIYYNAMSAFGDVWLRTPKDGEEFLLKKYCVLKNMPLALADFYKIPLEVYGKEKLNCRNKVMFEWDGILQKIHHLE